MPADQPKRRSGPKRVSFIGTYVPRRCGIATFSNDLLTALTAEAPNTEWWSVALNDAAEGYDYPPEVHFEIGQKTLADYRKAVDFLNMNQVDAVCLQHEFGIYGGSSGSYVLRPLENLRMPVVTTLHTVLREPNREQREIISAIGDFSDRVVVMSEMARGYPDVGLRRPEGAHRHHSARRSRHAVPRYLLQQGSVRRRRQEGDPDLRSAVGRQGHRVRHRCAARDRRVPIPRRSSSSSAPPIPMSSAATARPTGTCFSGAPANSASTITSSSTISSSTRRRCSISCRPPTSVVTPYLNREQIVSGVLSYALGAGKAIVSTPYWYAEEMLANGRGRIVPFRDRAGDRPRDRRPALRRRRAERHAQARLRLLPPDDLERSRRPLPEALPRRPPRARRAPARLPRQDRCRRPRPSSCRCRSSITCACLTDDTGILQHARFDIPDRDHGYCTDDNARALIVALLAQNVVPDDNDLAGLAHRYLGFLQQAFNQRQRPLPQFHELRPPLAGRDRQRGFPRPRLVGARPDRPRFAVTGHGRRRHVPVRTGAAARDGTDLAARLRLCAPRHRGLSRAASAARPKCAAPRLLLAERLYGRFTAHATTEWPWPEERLAYANGLLPHALIAAGARLGNTRRWSTRRSSRSTGWSRCRPIPRVISSRSAIAAGSTAAAPRRASISSRSRCSTWPAPQLEAYRVTGDRTLARRGAPLLRVVPRPQRSAPAGLSITPPAAVATACRPRASTRTRAPNRRSPGSIR